jgi:trimeric autotransporter adhesin
MKNLHTQLAALLFSTLCLLTGAFGQLTPTGDSYTNTAAATTNYGAKTLLDVESTQTTFIQFNLESIPSGYTSADITKATLKLYVSAVTKAGSFNVDYINGTWTESTLDASNAPALGTTIQASVPLTAADKNQYILVDVTAAVQAWLSGTANDGIALVANSPLNATFDSKESTTTSHSAELDIVFAGGGDSGITGITTAAGSGLIGGGTSGTLNLSLLTTCASGQVLEWTGTAWACATPKGSGTITGVTAGTDLTGGGTSGNVTLNLNTTATNALYAQLNAANTFTGNQSLNGTLSTSASSSSAIAVEGLASSSSGSTTGVLGVTGSTSGVGVNGLSTATSGVTSGVVGGANSPAGYGVYGANNATTGNAVGVVGSTAAPFGYGVYGTNNSQTGIAPGIFGQTASSVGSGVVGLASSSTGSASGVIGESSSGSGFGVYGTSNYMGVLGNVGVTGISTAGLPYGTVGVSSAVGVFGSSVSPSVLGGESNHVDGIWGDYGGAAGGGDGILGTADNSIAGVFGNNGATYPSLLSINMTSSAGGEVFDAYMPNLLAGGASAIIGDPGCGESGGNMGLQLGQTGMSGCANYTLVGNNVGDTYLNAVSGQTVHLRIANADHLTVTSSGVSITGTLSATGTKNFRIDHPLDPANKYLTHAAIESSEVLNLYSGNATLDDSGAAVVQLPDWFEAINKDFRYQLTNIGGFAPVYIAEEVSGGRFKIAGGKPGAKVSWQVSGVRNDAWEKAYPMVVEADKGADRGHYLTPELYGQPTSARIGYDAVPEGQKIVHHQRPNLLRGNAPPAKTITLPAPPKLVLPKAAPLSHAAVQVHQ